MSAPPIMTLLNKFKEKKTILMLASVACILLAVAYYYFSMADKKYPMACSANLVLSNNNENDLTANVIIKISRTKDNILAQISGTLRRNGVETNISRSVFFSVQDECCYSHLVTKKINISSVDNTADEYLKPLFPVYYLKKDESANLNIYPQKNGDVIYSNGTHVYFICKNTL